MSNISERLANLSLQEKRVLLAQLLREKASRVTSSYPLSHGQQALWFLYQSAPESAAYNGTFTVRIRSNLDVRALQSAFQALIARHPMLRTTFPMRGGKPIQEVHGYQEVCFEETDASTWTWDELTRRVVAAFKRPFDLERGPVLRVNLFTRSVQDHILSLAIHHIAGDGWSGWMLMDELRVLYPVEKNGTRASLPPLTLSYEDYVRWQDKMLASSEGERLWDYWRQQLAGELPVLNLPTDRPRPPVQTYQGASHVFKLTGELTQRLKGLAQVEGATLYMILLAAFQALLHRYTGQEDILVGSPTAGRSQPEFAGILGYFVNPVVLRADLSGNPTFKAFLTQVRQTVLAAIAHQDYPFPLLVERLQPKRDPSRSPLFQTLFVLQKPQQLEASVAVSKLGGTGNRVNWGGLELELFEIAQQEGQFDLTLAMREIESGLKGVLAYNSDLFEAATIARMAGHFQTLIEGIVANPEQRIADLPLLTEAEQHQLLVEWNDTQADYPFGKCIHQLFEVQVERTPDAVAVVFEDQELTYRELNARANQLAHYLQGLGVCPEVLLGICVERSVEMVVGLLGILKVGGAYLPLDPAYPSERLGFIVEETQVPLLLTQKHLVEELPQRGVPVVCLDTDWEEIARESTEPPVSEVTPQNLAYVMYTSGSTGKPKGVQINHAHVWHYIQGISKVLPINANDVYLHTASFSFTASVRQLMLPLSQGATSLIATREQTQTPLSLFKLIQKQGVTVSDGVPSVWRYGLMALESLDEVHTEVLRESKLRLIVFGGELLPYQLLNKLRNQFKNQPRFFNVLGQTETLGHSVYSVPEDWDQEQGYVPVGYPLSHVEQVYILDDHLQPVTVGEPGELHVAGASLTRGYLNRPEVNAEKFISNPFHPQSEQRLFKTGDLARYLPDGTIELLGRVDFQVNIRGMRVELGEIESLLESYPSVKEAVVIAREDAPGDKRLVAYIVSKLSSDESNQTRLTRELRSFLTQKLPDYMVPNAFVLIDALPLTPNGKVDRRVLPPPNLSRRSRDFVAPRTSTEEVLAAIWADVLGLEKVGIYEEFLELGGHSLLATLIISRLREAFSIELPVSELFEFPTVAGLSEQIDAARCNNQRQPMPSLQPVSRDQELPLSLAQQRLWLLDQMEGGSAAYNIARAMRLEGRLDIAALEQAVTEIARRHEALRTTFKVVNNAPVQVIAPTLTLTLPLMDLQGLSEAEQSAEVQRLVTEEVQRPFDLAKGPLLRVKLLRQAPECHVLLVTMHHIVSDFWSVGIFMGELSILYQAFSTGLPYSLPELPIQYADFAHWQRQWLTGEVLETQLNYWKQQLAGAPPLLELPTDRPRPPIQSFRGRTRHFQLNPDLTQRLKTLSQQSGATLFMTLLAAFVTLLSRYSGQEDVVIGSPIANRNRIETELPIGFFLNTLVLRNNLEENPTFSELLGRVRKMALDASAYQHLPFEQLVEVLQPERDLSYSPWFQVMFIFLNVPMGELKLPGLDITPLDVEKETSMFDLTLSMMEAEQGLQGSFEYSTDLFDVTTINRMVGHFQTLLEGIAANPEQRVAELPLLSVAEQNQLLMEWNDIHAEDPKDIDQLVPTVLDLTVAIPQSQAEKVGDEEIARMLAELEGLSDEEAQRLLTEDTGKG